MARLTTLVIALAFVYEVQAAPCTGSPSDCVEVQLTVDGRERLYQYHVPQGASCPSFNLPVVMFLHGGGGRADGARGELGYASSDRNCHLLVFPEAVVFPTGGLWNPGDCIGLPASSGYRGPQTGDGCGYGLDKLGIDDVRYMRALLDDLKSRVSYDTRRVYASGFSHGAGMVQRLACELSTRITAIAAIEGTIKVPQCTPARGVPVIQWAALGDTRVPYAGGTGDTSVPYTMSVHLANLGLPPFTSPTSTSVVNSTRVPGVTDSVRVWSGTSSVVLHTLSQPLDHTWLFDDPVAFDWQETNWTFFKQYALPPAETKRRTVRH